VNVHVFLGPTLPAEEARRILDAHYLPPVAMGDIYALTRPGRPKPAVLAIIDGFFEQTPAVWHKEILWALSQGVRVFGSSSMGALRAAELAPFGMEGIGHIAAAYQSGELEDDDEVAVVHGPAEDGYRALSDAMVNLRLGLRRAVEEGLLSAATRDCLLKVAKRLYYPERSWARLVAEGRALGVAKTELDALQTLVKRENPDQKRDDAKELLSTLARLCQREIAPHSPHFDFEPTSAWMELERTQARRDGTSTSRGASATAEQLANHVRLFLPKHKDLARAALLHHLVRMEARRAGLVVKSLGGIAARFRRERQLLSVRATDEWMTTQRMTKHDFAELLETEALTEELLVRRAAEVTDGLAEELTRRGELGAIAQTVEQKWAWLSERGLRNPTLADAGVEERELAAWYEAQGVTLPADVGAFARDLGFDSQRAFMTELLSQYLYAKRSAA
jgi:hypothetical protein